jgi:hypothetical protein
MLISASRLVTPFLFLAISTCCLASEQAISQVCSRKSAPLGLPYGEPPPLHLVAADATTPVARAALSLAYAIENGSPDPYVGVTGNFDGTGLSLGTIQFNFLGSIQSTFRAIPKSVYARTMPSWGDTFYDAVHTGSPGDAVAKVLAMQETTYSPRTARTLWILKPEALGELRTFLGSDESRDAQNKAASLEYQRGYSRALQWAQARGAAVPAPREIASFVDNQVFSGGELGGIWMVQAKAFRADFQSDGDMIGFVAQWLRSCPYSGPGFLYGRDDAMNSTLAWIKKYPSGTNLEDERGLLFAFGFLRALTANGPPSVRGQPDQHGIFKSQVVTRRSLPALGTGTANGVTWPGGVLGE